MYNLNNINVAKFYRLNESQAAGYMELSKILNPKGIFCKKPAKSFYGLEFGQVSVIKATILKPTYAGLVQAFELVFGTPESKQKKAGIVEYFHALKYLTLEVEKILKRESKALTGKQDPFLEMAGADRLAKFGELPALKLIGMQYGKGPNEIASWPYSLVFSLLYMEAVEADVRERYNELKNSKK